MGSKRVISSRLFVVGFVILGLLSVPLYAAGSEEAGWGWIKTIGRWFNLLFLFGVIYYFARKPVAQFLAERRENIQREIKEAHAAREEAEQKLATMEKKMQGLEAELEEMRLQAQAEADAEKQRILEQAEEESKKIVASVERQIEGLTRAARQDLREYAVELSLEMATKRIVDQMDSQAQGRVIDRFLIQLANSSEEDK
jgi:F-type H+-transporting ATPase subunit b